MNKVFAVDCSPLLDERRLQETLPYLDALRQQRVHKLSSPDKKAQCAAAGWLLTCLFGENGNPPALFHGSRGKPYLANRDDAFFSLSHSGNWVFCAVSDKEVGLDAQALTPYREAVAARCFTAEERAWIDGNDKRFTDLWTMKEAYLKFTGFGLVLPMSSFTVPFDGEGVCGKDGCFYQLITPPVHTLSVTLCSGDASPVENVEIVNV